jgi:isopenicillin N synthase-like dioxygenase
MHIYTPPKPATNIPVIDIAGGSFGVDRIHDRAAQEIHKACRENGFFYISNHGVASGLIDAQFETAKRFFDLPLDRKMALSLRLNRAAVGYEPIGGQKLDSQDTTKAAAPPDLKESFNWGTDVADDHPYATAGYRGYGRNQAPSIPGFEDQMNAYAEAMRCLGDSLLELVARSLDLPDDWFKPFFRSKGGKLRMIKYPPHPKSAQFNQLGAGAHTDWGAITILAQDDIGGLEVQNVAGEWIEARPIPATFIINIGDLMARWSNGIYNSNFHRVRNNSTARDRYSIPFFYDADPPAVIEAIPTCVTVDQPIRYSTCTADEHIADMFQRSYGYRPGEAKAS